MQGKKTEKKPERKIEKKPEKKPAVKAVEVMIVDDHPVLREGIKQILESGGAIHVCGEAASANEAVELMARLKPDLAIIDITLAGGVSGLELVKSARERFPELKTLVLSMHDESIYAERSIKAGANGYLMKEVAAKNIIEAIEKIMKGGLYVSPRISDLLLAKLLNPSGAGEERGPEVLSNREFEIFNLISGGFSTREIASKLNLSIYTIESHKRNMTQKLGLKNSSELVKYAIQWRVAAEK